MLEIQGIEENYIKLLQKKFFMIECSKKMFGGKTKMFAYIKGKVEEKSSNYVVIDVGGIGYKIFMSNISINEIGEIGKTIKVHTYYYVREDNISLYGFLTKEELRMFELLLSVSGIGAKSAIAMLSNIKLKKVPGIGAKTAQRIVLELQDKLKAEQELTSDDMPEIVEVDSNENVVEATAALQILGYNKKEIDKMIEKVDKSDLSVEDLIKKGLSLLARN